jgi:predicted alpha/beta-fold hydrolase
MMSFKLHPNRYPFGRQVIFHLPNNVKLKGLLAMKTDGKKRPLIILRTGIFSNTQEFYPERSAFIQLFEQGPFNVLVLESSSGSEFLKHNRDYAIGGFDEGLQNFWLAQKLQNPSEPISKYIQSVHMAGVSLGGHGVLLSALLNELNPGPQGQRVVQSALGICPLLNMQDTLDYHMSQGFSMDLMNYWASRRLKVLKDRIPELKDSVFLPQFFNWLKRNYRGPLIAENGKIEGIRLPPEAEQWLAEKKTPEALFWKLNHYWPWYQKVQTPVLILSTEKDPIVSWFINSGRLQDGRMKLQDSNIEMFTFEQGFHCSLPVAYDWSSIATLMQTFFLKMSPDFKPEVKEVRLPLPAAVISQFQGKTPYLDLSFEAPEMSAALFVSVRFDSEFWPSWSDRLLAPRMSAQLPLSEMEFPLDEVVRNPDESSLLRRWAYQNIEARISGSDIIFRWKVTPP